MDKNQTDSVVQSRNRFRTVSVFKINWIKIEPTTLVTRYSNPKLKFPFPIPSLDKCGSSVPNDRHLPRHTEGELWNTKRLFLARNYRQSDLFWFDPI